MLNTLQQARSKNQKSSNNVITLELLDPYTCIIANIPFKLSDNIIYTHELIPSYKHQGYAAKLKMLNSLKRCFEQMNLTLGQLPNLSFKMFKNVNGNYNNFNMNMKRLEPFGYSKFRRLKKTSSQGYYKYGFCPIQRQSIMHIGRWILTPHQRRTVEYFLRRGKRMIIGDDWNMGKTVTALACMHYGKCKKLLIIVPKILLYHWIWHINQLKLSLSKQKVRQQQRKAGQNPADRTKNTQIFIQVLDLQLLSNEEKRNMQMDVENAEKQRVKGQNSKKQIKLKRQQNSINNYTYYLCSYQYIENNSIQPAHYSGLILDQPQIYHLPQQQPQPQPQPYQAYPIKKQQISSNTLRQIRKIQSIIILKSIPPHLTRELLPILNVRLDWQEVADRYGGNHQPVMNYNQYTNAVLRSYYHSCRAEHVQVPGGQVKRVLVPFRQCHYMDVDDGNNEQNKYKQKQISVSIEKQKQKQTQTQTQTQDCTIESGTCSTVHLYCNEYDRQ